MTRAAFALAMILPVSPVVAGCATQDATFLSCRIEGSAKRIEVCIEPEQVIYRYGPAGAPELTLAVPMSHVAYRPWPGVGRTIWEEIDFYNGAYRYAVFGGIDRDYTGEEILPVPFGGVEVYRGEVSISRKTCDPSDVTFPWSNGISEAKAALGQVFELRSGGWVTAPAE